MTKWTVTGTHRVRASRLDTKSHGWAAAADRPTVTHVCRTLAIIAMLGIVATEAYAQRLQAALSGQPRFSEQRDGRTLPADVHPETRNRLPGIPGASGSASGADGIRGRGSGVDVRWESVVGRPLLELAILTTAREHDQPYEWSLHEMEAVAVGLDPAVIDIVRNRASITGLGEAEAVVINLGREMFGQYQLSFETYARAVSLFDEGPFVDVVLLMSRYASTAIRLTAFNQHMPPGWPQFLPLPFTLPDDIDLDSRSRLPRLPAPAERLRRTPSLYGRTLSPEGTGPGQIRGHGAGLASLEAHVPRSLIDLAILVTAREYDSQYVWTVTEPSALEHGLAPEIIDIIRHDGSLTGLAESEAALIAFGRELLGVHTVRPETYQRVSGVFSTSDLVDLVDVMAGYVADITLLIAFDQQLPEGQRPLLTPR
ncbi:MAG: hypothetical protein VYE68_05135 [Acidobacteriota bacterium]|nr:hypothetical protein [Acidobacteriota bacterium]